MLGTGESFRFLFLRRSIARLDDLVLSSSTSLCIAVANTKNGPMVRSPCPWRHTFAIWQKVEFKRDRAQHLDDLLTASESHRFRSFRCKRHRFAGNPPAARPCRRNVLKFWTFSGRAHFRRRQAHARFGTRCHNGEAMSRRRRSWPDHALDIRRWSA